MTSTESLRIKVAELCGWTGIDGDWGYKPNPDPKAFNEYLRIPDYCHDLNAMHEVEKTLNATEREDYDRALIYECSGNDVIDINGSWYPALSTSIRKAISATARQRAEAFVKVKEG